MKSFYKKLILWIMSTKLYRFLLKLIVPYIRFSTGYTKTKGYQYHQLYDKLESGDVILTLDKKKFTSLLIPGEFSHAAFCVSKDKNWEVSEMTHSDYTKSCFFDICKESDRVVILGVKNVSQQDILDAVAKCKALENAKYDGEFKLGIEALYCSELPLVCWGEKLQADLSDLIGLGRPYLSPTGLFLAKGVFVKADSSLVKKSS